MKTMILVLVLVLGSARSAVFGGSPNMPDSTIIVDEEHSQFARQDQSHPPSYVVPPGDAVELDASRYSFPAKTDYAVPGPNVIAVIMGRDQKYRLLWKPGVQKYTLSSDTLKPELGSIAFTGFHTGDTFSVIVAFEDPKDSKPADVRIKMLWGCLVTVK